jgi:hypothetical protein
MSMSICTSDQRTGLPRLPLLQAKCCNRIPRSWTIIPNPTECSVMCPLVDDCAPGQTLAHTPVHFYLPIPFSGKTDWPDTDTEE